MNLKCRIKYRLAKLFRLFRLVKIAKLLKVFFRSSHVKEVEEEITSDEDIDIKMSVVGRKMTERITKKGIIHILLSTYLSL